MPGERSPLRILHIFRTPVGGLFRHVMDVARGQVARGHAVGIVCDSSTGGARAEAALEDLAPQLALGLSRFPMSRNPGLADIAGLKEVRRIVQERRPDIVHGHGSKGGLYARLPAFYDRAWPARVYTPHGGSFHFAGDAPRDKLYRLVEKILSLKTSLFLMESAYIARRAEQDIGPLKAPVVVVRNGITDAEFEPVVPEPDAKDVLYLGEMRVLKGVDTLLQALARLSRDGRRLSALLVGAGPDEQNIKNAVQELGLAGQVSFAPPIPIREALGKARLMVVPSRGESLPYVVLEAAAARIPLVATNVGGIPEIFGPSANRLIPPGEPGFLAATLKNAFSKSEVERLTEAASLAAYVRAGFSYDAMIEGGLAAYRRALEQGPFRKRN
jgi:glycosyltransferase involved in cell wall biosynthesis